MTTRDPEPYLSANMDPNDDGMVPENVFALKERILHEHTTTTGVTTLPVPLWHSTASHVLHAGGGRAGCQRSREAVLRHDEDSAQGTTTTAAAVTDNAEATRRKQRRARATEGSGGTAGNSTSPYRRLGDSINDAGMGPSSEFTWRFNSLQRKVKANRHADTHQLLAVALLTVGS
jgi:hypothetical protein